MIAYRRLVGAGLAAFVVVLAGAAAAAPKPNNLQLIPNSTGTIDVPGGVKKISVANPGVVDARPSDDGTTVLVAGTAVGTSDVRISQVQGEDLIYHITVIPDLKSLAEQITQLLSSVEGLKISVVGNKVVLDGQLLTRSDYDRVKAIEGAYEGTILNLTKLDRAGMDKFVAEALARDIGQDTVQVRVAGDTATLEGFTYDEADITRAVEVAKLRVPQVVNLLKVEEVMIETDVYFLQMDTSNSKEIGYNILKNLGIEASAGASGGTGGSETSYSVGGSVSARIHALVGKGDAKILAQPHLSTKSGGEGSFHSGGETYFEVAGINAGSLEKVEYGVIMRVKPTLRGKERIMNEITIEVSVPSATSKNAFSLDKFETSSMTMCKVGESVVISGLAQTLESRFKEKTPLLGSIPVLSAFFSETRKSRQDRELVVILTPKPVFPKPSAKASRGEESLKLLDKQEKQD